MDIKRILKALLKTLRDIAIIGVISALTTLLVVLMNMFLGISILYIIIGLVIFSCVLVITVSYYEEGGKNE